MCLDILPGVGFVLSVGVLVGVRSSTHAGGIDGMGLSSAMQLPGMAAFMAQRSAAAASVPTTGGVGVAAAQLKAAMAM